MLLLLLLLPLLLLLLLLFPLLLLLLFPLLSLSLFPLLLLLPLLSLLLFPLLLLLNVAVPIGWRRMSTWRLVMGRLLPLRLRSVCGPMSRLAEIVILYVILRNRRVWRRCWLSRWRPRYSLVAPRSTGTSKNCNSKNTQISSTYHQEIQIKSWHTIFLGLSAGSWQVTWTYPLHQSLLYPTLPGW